MSFARFASATAPLAFKPPPLPKAPPSNEPWGKPHKWLFAGGRGWTLYPLEPYTEEGVSNPCYRGYMIHRDGHRSDDCVWYVAEMELIEE